MTAMLSEKPARESFTAPPPRRKAMAKRLAWVSVLAVLVIYGIFMGRWIGASTVIPTHDQAAYMKKTYAIAETFYHHPLHILNPLTYFGMPAANRPPLMMVIAAALAGPEATPSTIGIIWLVTRLLVLLAGLAVAARVVGSVRFVPAAAMTILAGPGWLTLHYNMYMMDQPFEAFALLAFGLLVADSLARSPHTAWRAAVGTLLVLWVKPAGLVLLFPMFVILAWQFRKMRIREPALIYEGQRRMDYCRQWVRPYFIVGGVFLALVVLTPYGWAVGQQYLLGHRGYWAQERHFVEAIGMFALLVPPWLLALAGLSVAWRGTGYWTDRGARMFVAAGALTVSGWYLFNAVITYTLDSRVLSGGMTIAVVTALVFVTRSRALTALATMAAALFFAASLLAAAGMVTPGWAKGLNAFSPLPTAQKPIAEVGALELARRIKQTVADADNTAGFPGSRGVMIVSSDDFIELTSMQLAMRFTGGDAGIMMDSHPWGSTDFDLERMLQRFQWYLTKDQRKFPKLSGDVWTSLIAIDALIQDPKSPWHEKFEKVWEIKVHQPDMEDTVAFWHLRVTPSKDDMLAALDFMIPYFKGTDGEAVLAAQRQAINGP